jgi:nitrate reductase gamma subunit
VCSARIGPIVKAIVLDVLLQRRLYRQSKKRWLIHGLIFYPFVFRCLWGLVALAGSLWVPERIWVWSLLDKDNPATAFLFDLTGVMLVVGLSCALLRGIRSEKGLLPGLPGQDRLALALIGGTVVIGFLLEGMRIAMAGHPPGSELAFLGYAISHLFRGPFHLTGVYGYIWYLHAAFTGAFIAYLPFSRLAHIIMAPVVLAMGAGDEERHRGTEGRVGQ